MGLFITNEIKSLYVGDKAVVAAYLGSEKIWESKNLICTYTTTEPGDTQIIQNIGPIGAIIVDGVSVKFDSNYYNFEEVGEHTIEFVLGGMDEILSNMFSGINVESVIIPNGITVIGSNTFRNCLSLTRVTIPNSTYIINSHAFYNCSQLSEITYLGTTEAVIASGAFRNISSFGILKVPAGSNTGLESQLPGGWIVEYI